MSRFTPRTEEELYKLRYSIIAEDEVCDFEILEAEDKVSSNSGNDMTSLKLKAVSRSGEVATINDHLIYTDKMLWKVKHCCESIGIVDKFESGNPTDRDYAGKRGKLIIGIQKDPTGVYRDKNVVKDYIVVTANNAANDFEDDIPF